MTPSDWFALAGLVLAALSSAGTVYGVLNGRISRNARDLHQKVEEVKRDYVRRDDLRDDMQRIERGQENLAAKMDVMSQSFLAVTARLAEAALAVKGKQP